MASQERIYRDRRAKLAAFLRTPFVRRHFNLGDWVHPGEAVGRDEDGNLDLERVKRVLLRKEKPPPHCGTTACVAGWCPAVFPRAWEWTGEYGYPHLKKDAGYLPTQDFATFFGLTHDEAGVICLPGSNPYGSTAIAAQCAALLIAHNRPNG